MRHSFFSINLLLAFGVTGLIFLTGFLNHSVEKKNQVIDGPYVFHHGKKLVVKKVVRTEEGTKMLKEYYHSKESKDLILSCSVTSLKNESFEFKLMPELKVPVSSYPPVEKLLAISDIEGNYYALKALLVGLGVMDKNHQWTFGDGHLVLVGDFFDRGDQVTAVLWLLYELERQAKAKGGMVHFILGNHEVMNLRGDTRYTVNKYLEVAKSMGMEYKDLYSKKSELGRWLRTKNVVEKIGDILFVHGGISKKMMDSGLTIDEINRIARQNLGYSLEHINSKGSNSQLVFSEDGPLWYRGYLTKPELIKDQLPAILSHYQVNKVVIGHTSSKDISRIYNGEVCSIDVIQPIRENNERSAKALLKEGDNYFKVDDKNRRVKL